MSRFLETFLAALAGVSVFYLAEAIYYDVKARIRGRQYVNFFDDLEEESWDK
jgi:hypothetical protein